MSANNTQPSLCTSGCGFFGRPENKNLCSSCYRDHVIKEAAKHLASLKVDPVTPKSSDSLSTSTVKKEQTVSISAGGVKTRCNMCNRKVGLLGFECRCGNVYCKLHRLPEEHSCPSDYKRTAEETLVKQNPLIKADKLNRV